MVIIVLEFIVLPFEICCIIRQIFGGVKGKKKREHVVFDQMLKTKKSIPFFKLNSTIKLKDKEKRNIHRVIFILPFVTLYCNMGVEEEAVDITRYFKDRYQ